MHNATDIDDDTLTLVNTTQPVHGALTATTATGGFTYTPATNWHGTDAFDFTVTDGAGAYATATAVITVGE